VPTTKERFEQQRNLLLKSVLRNRKRRNLKTE